ncbi:MAG TPA: hypothetical protein VK524_34210, partial [Polyangiaceae bacterium]|nr:hypothetical protein [Polyangiaceae bacterium]
AGGAWTLVPQNMSASGTYALLEEHGKYRRAHRDEPQHAELVLGASDLGGFMRYTPFPAFVPASASIAPRVAAAFELAEREFGVQLGPLEHAEPRR